MNPRRAGTPAREQKGLDDFDIEDAILDSPADPLEMFLPESETGTAEAPLDLGEFALRRSSTEAATLRRRRSILRSAPGVVGVALLLALIIGAALRTLDVSALSKSLVTARNSAPPAGRVPPPAVVVRDSAAIESTPGKTNNRPPTITAKKSVATPLTSSRPSASTARGAAALSRTAPPAPRAIERRPESRPPSPAIAATTASSTTLAVNSASPVSIANSAPEAPAASSAPATAAVTSAAALSAPNAPPPPAPLSAPTATPTAGPTAEPRGVAVALNRYQEAFSTLNADAAHAVWPNVDVKALAKAFDQLEEQTFDLEGCNITVAGPKAEADCGGNARYIRKIGNRALRVEPRRWHFTLRQTNDQWVIDAVNAR